jgi:cation diffusion facilitator family transporter
MDHYNTAVKVSILSIILNIVLSIVKFVAGLLGKSSAMISDAVHSFSDVLSTFVVIAGIKLASKEADKEHPYGHERLESVASIILACMLVFVGFELGAQGVNHIRSGEVTEIPGRIALLAAIISILVKEGMFWYTKGIADRINSGALLADAWHHRSDALSSIGSFIGIMFARLGFPIMDSIASVIISLFIIKAAYEIFKDGVDKMVDHSCSSDKQKEIEDTVLNIDGVLGIDDIKTRLFGSKLYVDIEILADGNLSLRDSHSIAENVHHKIESTFPDCKHCMVHVNPL